MRSLRRTWVAALVILAVVATWSAAEDTGWKLPTFNPFKSDKPAKKRAAATVTDSEPTFHLPKLPSLPKPHMPSFFHASSPSSRPSTSKSGPSPLTKVTEGTKEFFAKTYDVLTPWDNSPSTKKSTSPPLRKNSSKSGKGSGHTSWFPWFHSKPEEPSVRTVNEFLDLPRVQP